MCGLTKLVRNDSRFPDLGAICTDCLTEPEISNALTEMAKGIDPLNFAHLDARGII